MTMTMTNETTQTRATRAFETKRGDRVLTALTGPGGRPVAAETKVRRVIKTEPPIDTRRFAICRKCYNGPDGKPREWGRGAYVIVDVVTGYTIKNYPISETIRDAEAHFWYTVERMGGPELFVERMDTEERRIGNIRDKARYGEVAVFLYADIAGSNGL